MSGHLVDPKRLQRTFFQERYGVVCFDSFNHALQQTLQGVDNIRLGIWIRSTDGAKQLKKEIRANLTVVQDLTAAVKVQNFKVRLGRKTLNQC